VRLDPVFSPHDDVRVGDLYERFEIDERKWVEIEAADEQAAAVDSGHLRVQDRLGPLVNGNTCLEKPTVESPRGCTRKWNIAPTREQ
jgi:hypothetical protein